MSYDIYCYKSSTGFPDLKEAEEIISFKENNKIENLSEAEKNRMETIAQALLKLNPKLERFSPNYAEIAKSQNISIDEAKLLKYEIEINSPLNSKFHTQIIIFKDNVSISFGWNSPDKIIDNVLKYTQTISKTSGYLVYDPQSNDVYDPLHSIPLTKEEKQSWLENDEINFLKSEKPWWKFW